MKDKKPRPKKLTPDQDATLIDVFDMVFEELKELQGARIATLSALTGLITVLSRRGVLEPGDEDMITSVAEVVTTKLERAELEGVPFDEAFRTPATDEEIALMRLRKGPRKPSRKR